MPCPAVQRLRQRPQAFLAPHRLPFDMLRAGLGSTAITADSNESRVARLRHKAWGDSCCTLEPIRKTGAPLRLWLDRLAFHHVIRIGSQKLNLSGKDEHFWDWCAPRAVYTPLDAGASRRRAEAPGSPRRSPPVQAISDYFFKDHRVAQIQS